MYLPVLVGLLFAAEPSGVSIYLGQCAICHGQRGEGGRGAPLARAKLRHAADDEALQRVIRRGIPGRGMPGTWLNDAETREVAAYVRSLGRGVTPAAVPGDAARGEAIYKGKGGCVRCHMISGYGGGFGPDLTGIGGRRNAAHLRESIVAPAADVPPNFVLLHAVSARGIVTGTRVNEDTFSVQIRDASGKVHSFWKTELRELRKEMGKTAMPSYQGTLSPGELDDVVAYLARLEEEGQ
jgi:putative heme-binding domain-containing protein